MCSEPILVGMNTARFWINWLSLYFRRNNLKDESFGHDYIVGHFIIISKCHVPHAHTPYFYFIFVLNNVEKVGKTNLSSMTFSLSACVPLPKNVFVESFFVCQMCFFFQKLRLDFMLTF